MRDKEFDAIIKSRLENYESQVPADMWERITGKKRRRFGFIWWQYTTLFIALLLISGLYIFYPRGENKTVGTNSSRHDNPNDSAMNTNAITQRIQPVKSIHSNDLAWQPNNMYKHLASTRFEKSDYYNLPNETPGNTIFSQLGNSQRTDNGNLPSDEKYPPHQKNLTTEEGQDTTTITETDEDPDKISLSFFASPDILFNNIHSGNIAYQELLQNSIRMKLSYTLGVGINLSVSKRISLSTGIQYSRVNEQISQKDSIGIDTQPLKNHFSFLNVPFFVTYKTRSTATFQTSFKAGVLVNISSRYTGSMPGEFGRLLDVSQNAYKSNTSVSLYASINLSKPISEKVSLFAEPYFRYQIKNMADQMQPFTRKIHTAGVAVGIQYKLFKEEKE